MSKCHRMIKAPLLYIKIKTSHFFVKSNSQFHHLFDEACADKSSCYQKSNSCFRTFVNTWLLYCLSSAQTCSSQILGSEGDVWCSNTSTRHTSALTWKPKAINVLQDIMYQTRNSTHSLCIGCRASYDRVLHYTLKGMLLALRLTNLQLHSLSSKVYLFSTKQSCLTFHLGQISWSFYLMRVALWYILTLLTSDTVAPGNCTQPMSKWSNHDVAVRQGVVVSNQKPPHSSV